LSSRVTMLYFGIWLSLRKSFDSLKI